MPIVGSIKILSVHSSFGVRVVLFLFVWCWIPLHAQVVKVKLVDGRSGRPVAHGCVNVWVGDQRKAAIVIPTNSDGIASLRLTDRSDEVDIHNRWKGCGDSGVIDPVVLYADSIRINVGYVLCQLHPSPESWLAMTDFPTRQLIRDGIVTPNACGKFVVSQAPGEVAIFVRPLNFWEKLREL